MVDVSLDQLATEILRTTRDYIETTNAAVEREVIQTADAVLADVKSGSPERTGRYRRGWRLRKETSEAGLHLHAYNALKPGLTHLLEKGHAKRGGGRVAAKEHIGPAETANLPPMVERIRKIIRKGG